MKELKIKGQAVLIGYDPEGKCVYSDLLDLSDYYDGEHVWDSDDQVKSMRLRTVKGFLFDSKGALSQEFESVFDLKTGIYSHGHVRRADGTIQKDEERA